MEILNLIKDQIDWYYKNSQKAWINDLLTLQDKLSANSYYLAELYSEAYKQYIDKFYLSKTKKVKTFLSKKAEKIADKGLTDKLAEVIATDESLEEFKNELFWEAEVEKLKTLLRQVNIILQALQQRISSLKQERQNFNS